MIQANELRIGNYLYRSDGSIITVKRLIYNDNDILVNEINGLFTLGYTALPIPITEEILLKCGFEKQGGFWFVKGDIKIEITLSRVYFRYAGFVRLKYLHQLQNLYFALTGQELEVSWS